MRPTPSEKQRGPQSLPLRMENFGGAGKPESSKHFSAEIAAFASLWSVILGKRGLVFNSLTFSCYLASILCKNAEMPHFRAAFLLCIFFINTFWYARLDSNQRPSESELSGRQRKNRCGARVSVGLHKFSTIYRKLPEPLRCNGSGHFANSRQIVVSNPRPIKQSPLHPLHAHTNIPEQCRSPRRSRLQCHGQYKRSETPPHLPMGQMPAF